LRLCLIDPHQSLGDTCILQLALSSVGFDRCPSRLDRHAGLIHLRSVIVVLQLHDQTARMNLLVVGNVDSAHNVRHLGAQRCKIAANTGIVRDLLRFAALHAFQLRVIVSR
jgi:hypothetical protein